MCGGRRLQLKLATCQDGFINCAIEMIHTFHFRIIPGTFSLHVQPKSSFLHNMVEPAGDARKVDNWNQNKYIIAV